MEGERGYLIERKRLIGELIYEIWVNAPNTSARCVPGQFVAVMATEDGERIPLTIVDYDREKGSIALIFQTVGYSTHKLAELPEGGFIPVLLGPLGKPSDYELEKAPPKVLGIGGGVGSAPLLPQMKRLKAEGSRVDVILGGRSDKHLILKDEFALFADNLHIATDDGSLGQKGFVTDILKTLLEENYDLAVAIGPVVMMKAVVDITKPASIPTWVSLNPIMVDGTGMCGCCRVKIDKKHEFACIDGPDFDGFKVDFAELMKRQGFYREEEGEAKKLLSS